MRNASRRSRGSRLPREEGPLPGDITVRVIEFLITVASEDGTTRTERVSSRRFSVAPGGRARASRRGPNLADGLLEARRGDREPDGVVQAATVQPGRELVRAAGRSGHRGFCSR
jgi:hypothetical protein